MKQNLIMILKKYAKDIFKKESYSDDLGKN
jgi:hypothetical protein